ncbi:RHS repeat-associated core domain-containing protein [Streptomyces sp. NPDC060184]|uniref:RHS repeat-associated core domain-containing protein n=1 Tax=Streptomyces sp. NPDC060184 TaxID=3347064 RepID=UPI003667F5F4
MTTSAYDEYGNTLGAATATAYGWLGSHQRAGEGVSGLTLMGARLYDPRTGRFLQVDPVYGGNSDAYTYPGDPVSMLDLDGLTKSPRSCGIICQALFSAAKFGIGKIACKATGLASFVCAGLVGAVFAVLKYAYGCYERCWKTTTAAKKFATGFVTGVAGKMAFGKAKAKYGPKLTKAIKKWGGVIKKTLRSWGGKLWSRVLVVMAKLGLR